MRKLKHEKPHDMQEIMDGMSEDAQDHFRQLAELLLLCYADPPEARGVLLVEPKDGEQLAIASANASEIEVVELIREATAAMAHVIVADAPPKDLFN